MDNLLILMQSINIIQAKIKKSEAEEASSYHDLSMWKFPQILWTRARNVKHLLMALSFLGLPDYQQNEFRQKAHRIAEKYQFEGAWSEVEELLQLQTTAPGKIVSWYLMKHSPEDWFGDTLREIIKIIRSGKTYNPYLPDKRSVKRPQRKRGYDDKGSLSRYDKLGPEYYRCSERIKTEIPDLNTTLFYPDWYQKEKIIAESQKLEGSLFPEEEYNYE